MLETVDQIAETLYSRRRTYFIACAVVYATLAVMHLNGKDVITFGFLAFLWLTGIGMTVHSLRFTAGVKYADAHPGWAPEIFYVLQRSRKFYYFKLVFCALLLGLLAHASYKFAVA